MENILNKKVIFLSLKSPALPASVKCTLYFSVHRVFNVEPVFVCLNSLLAVISVGYSTYYMYIELRTTDLEM